MKKFNYFLITSIAATIILPTTISAKEITVKSGDTLYSLGRTHQVKVDDIKAWNGLKSNTLYIGQKLIVSKSEYAYVVNADRLNVRTGPGIEHSIKTTISKGTKVEVVETTSGWSKVNVSGIVGYVSSSYLAVEKGEIQSNTATITKVSGLFQSPGKNRVSSLAPQKVIVLERGEDGWLKIDTWRGDLWIKDGVLEEVKVDTTLLITKLSGLFKTPGKEKVSSLAPQRVKVVEKRADGWALIETWKGNLWIKNGVTEEIQEKKYIEFTLQTALFREPGKERVNSIKPQTVEIISEGTNGWYQVKTWLGPMWAKNGVMEEIVEGAPTTPEEPPKEVLYTVVAGDNLSTIAAKYKTTYQNIMAYNGLTSDRLNIGQILKIPTAAPASIKIFNMPVEGSVQMTSGFGPRWGTQHYGTDFSRWGDVKIIAAETGVVTRSEMHPTYGELIFIAHNIGGKDYETVYAHLREDSRTVKVGDRVQSGQFLGWMGTTGNSTGQHLHFEVHIGKYSYGKGTAVDPILYLK